MTMTEPNSVNCKIQWFYNEYFYSNYDREFFTQSPLADLISKLDINPDITYRQHRSILKNLPTPALFSTRAIKIEKQKLEYHRNLCRQKSKHVKYHSYNSFRNTMNPPTSQFIILFWHYTLCVDTCI